MRMREANGSPRRRQTATVEGVHETEMLASIVALFLQLPPAVRQQVRRDRYQENVCGIRPPGTALGEVPQPAHESPPLDGDVAEDSEPADSMTVTQQKSGQFVRPASQNKKMGSRPLVAPSTKPCHLRGQRASAQRRVLYARLFNPQGTRFGPDKPCSASKETPHILQAAEPQFREMGIYLTQVPTTSCGFKRAALPNI